MKLLSTIMIIAIIVGEIWTICLMFRLRDLQYKLLTGVLMKLRKDMTFEEFEELTNYKKWEG